jgi:acetyl esterase/lipase
VLLIEYRLAPENPFPAALEDATNAYQWLLQRQKTSGQILLAGDSAGGGLAIALLLHLRDQGLPLPALGICFSPWLDLSMKGESYQTNARIECVVDAKELKQSALMYLGSTDECDPLASPLYHDLSGLPPLLIQVGSEEILLSDSTRFAEKAKLSGVNVTLVVWPGMQHEWQFVASLIPEGKQALSRLEGFIKNNLNQ